MARPRRDVCGRLGQDRPYGETDVCSLPAGHEGPHHGRYRGMEWEDVPDQRHRANVTKPGTMYIPPGGNIRGN